MNPGVYDSMTGGEYFEQSEWVSASKLKRHLPEHFKPPSGSRDNLDFGCAVHTRILGAGDEVQAVVASSWATNYAKERRAQAYEAGRVPILEKELNRIETMADAVHDHPEASELFRRGSPEVSVFADVDGLQCRARIDWLTGRTAVDLKTTTSIPSPQAITRDTINYGYDLQADHFLRVLSAAGVDVDTFLFVFVGKEPPHHVQVVELDATFYERAAVLREVALERILHPDMAEPYPGAYGRLTLSTPRWAQMGG